MGIDALNNAFELGLKAETIPSQLAKAKPGDKQFGGLLQKVRKVCSFDEDMLIKKLRVATEESLRSGGRNTELDSARKALDTKLEEDQWQNASKHAKPLAQSDHQVLYECLQISAESQVDFMSWNVLEFPHLPENARHAPPESVRDGISPSCDAFL